MTETFIMASPKMLKCMKINLGVSEMALLATQIFWERVEDSGLTRPKIEV